MFKRGIGVDQTSGLLLNQKIDILLYRFFRRIFNFLCCWKKRKSTAKVGDVQAKEEEEVNRFERRTVLGEVKKNGVFSLFKTTTLQEPTFKELVIIYRLKSIGNDTLHSTLNPFHFYIKLFKNIPMADLEVVYPKKIVTLKPLDVLKFTATAIAAVLAAKLNMEDDAGAAAIFGLIAFIGLLVKVIFDHRIAVSYYENAVISALYDKTLDSNKGCILYLHDNIKYQEAKEALIGYTILSHLKKHATKTELDKACEEFIYTAYKKSHLSGKAIKVNFDVEDSLNKLAKLEIITTNMSDKHHALPLKEVEPKLTAYWQNLLLSKIGNNSEI